MTTIPGKTVRLRSMKDRRYATVRVDDIVVVNSRDREQGQFEDNAKSIDAVGMLKPIVVNDRFLEKTGKYELVCGEGRLLAHQRLGRIEIEAEIRNIDRKEAYLTSLIENMARVKPGTMWFAREVLRMKNAGMTLAEIGKIVGRSDSYLCGYITLAEKGDERLIRGVEQGIFPMDFAHRVAQAGEGDVQQLMMDAYDANLITQANLTQVKHLICSKLAARPSQRKSGTDQHHKPYSLGQLKRDIAQVTQKKASYVNEGEFRERRIMVIICALETLTQSNAFTDLLKAEGLQPFPKLHGTYGIEGDARPKLECLPPEGETNAKDN
jgi:ParB family chromosome partitioning protein